MIPLKEYIQINESGFYNGCKELAKHIAKEISMHPGKSKLYFKESELKEFENIFFDTLIISIDSEIKEDIKDIGYVINEDTAYNAIRWDDERKIFNFIEIKIRLINNWTAEWDKIVHELNHGWEDYQLMLKDPTSGLIIHLDKEKYDKTRAYTESKDSFERLIGYTEYVSTGIERRALVAQAMAKLSDNLDKYDTFEDALEYQKRNNEVFNTFVVHNGNFKMFKRFNRKRLCDTYRNLYENQYDDDKIIKILEQKLNKFEKALLKHINTLLSKYAANRTN